MMTQPMQGDSSIVDVLTDILAGLPHDPEALRARRQEILSGTAEFEPLRNPLAASLAACVATLRERASAVRKARSPGMPTEPLPEFAFHEKATMAIAAGDLPEPPPIPPEEDSLRAGEATAAAAHWSQDDRLLYEDILNLFDLGDQAGAMTSLERLIMLATHTEELATFLEKNGSLLQRLYEEHLGSLDRVPVPLKEARPIRIPTVHPPLVLDVLRLVDGHRTIRDILKRSHMGDLRTLASLAHMSRSGFLEMT